MNEQKYLIHLVCFFSEGQPNDNGLNLKKNKELILSKAKKYFDNIFFYTPKIFRNMKLDKYVNEYNQAGLVSLNPGMHKIGFCKWRPKILLIELEKMKNNDILVYRDCNILKYSVLGIYDNIRDICIKCLDICGFDFFVPRAPHFRKIRNLAKTNVIRELGENHPFTYEFPNMLSGLLLIVRKSDISLKLIKEWHDACLNESWINGEQYGNLDDEFSHSCPEQSILSIIIANWVRKKKYNIPQKYPKIGFQDRNLNKLFLYNEYDYLNLIDD